MANVFFTGKRDQFFRPLTHGDRECCAAVLRSLHDRVHGPNADYSEALTRELVVSMIFQVLGDPVLRALAFEPGKSISAEEERTYALVAIRRARFWKFGSNGRRSNGLGTTRGRGRQCGGTCAREAAVRIAKLITWQWGSLESREWAFSDAVLLTGESGSGKSTLLDSIQTLLTAAHQHLVQFNIGQDESTQSRRGGKEPRTLAAYALGQQAGGVFLRKRSTSYVALVFEPSEEAGENESPFTALVGVEAHEDASKATLSKSLFFIVRRALSLSQLLHPAAVGMQPAPVPLKDLYLHLQHQMRVGPEVVQRFEDKTSYLTHLYGAMMGKTAVSEAEAFRAAKSIVKAMAYKELGNVNDLVRDEILDAHDFSRDLDKMRELMRSMAGLKAEAERLQLNIERLEVIAAAAERVLDESRRFVVTTIAHGMRAVDDADGELESVRRQMALQVKRNQLLEDRLENLRDSQKQLDEQMFAVQTQLAASDVAQRKAALESEVRTLQEQFRSHWVATMSAAGAMTRLVAQLDQLLELDLTTAPALAAAVDALRPTAQAVLRPWPAIAAVLGREAKLDADFPAFELESFDADLVRLEYGIRGHDESLSGAVVIAMAQASQQRALLADERTQRDAELRIGSRGYGMFSCRAPDQDLAFGEATRKRRMLWCEQEVSRLEKAIAGLDDLQRSLGAVSRMFSGAAFMAFAPLMEAVLSSQLQYANAARSLAALDLSSIEALEAERQALGLRIKAGKDAYDTELLQVGENNKTLKDLCSRTDAVVHGHAIPRRRQGVEREDHLQLPAPARARERIFQANSVPASL